MKKIITLSLFFLSLFFFQLNQINASVIDNVIDSIKELPGKPKEIIDNYVENKKTELIDELEGNVNKKLQEIEKDFSGKIKYFESLYSNKIGELNNEVDIAKNELRDVKDWKDELNLAWQILLWILGLIVLIKLIFLVLKLILKLILYIAINKTQVIQFNQKRYLSVNTKIQKSISVNIEKNFFVKKNSILKYGNSKITLGFPFGILKIWNYFKGFYLTNKIETGNITLTSPNHFSYITEIIVPKNSIFVFNLGNLLGFENGVQIKSKWKFDWSSFLEGKHIFHYVEGPATLYMYGVGELVVEKIVNETSFEKDTVIGYSGNLKRNVSIVEKFWLFLLNNSSIKERFYGKGIVIRQKIGVPDRQLRKLNKNGNDYLGTFSDIIGIIK